MLNFQTTATAGQSYATTKNARFSNASSEILTIKERWDNTFNSLPPIRRQVVELTLTNAINEFRTRHPQLTCWADVQALLPETKWVIMDTNKIDGTMQRLLKQLWSIEIVNNFMGSKVVPIQVYQPDASKDEYIAWDGQHTLVALWIIATQIFGEDPSKIMVPVNVYKTHQKSEMRDSFVGHNGGEYKEQLDQFDKIEQIVYGVRVDGSQNPEWLRVEEKQSIVESYDLFLTKADFGDADQPGAISRMQEFLSLHKDSLTHLCEYLTAVGCNTRSAQEKELVMMAYFFDRCRSENVKVTKQLIYDVAGITKRHWKADFTPTSSFWVYCSSAYYTWHKKHVVGVDARFSKETNHGYPFLVEQLKKDLPQHTFPSSLTGSNFVPTVQDLF
jgi:hypothetical protein